MKNVFPALYEMLIDYLLMLLWLGLYRQRSKGIELWEHISTYLK